jgi:signal transduction histidine kinase
MLVLAALGDRHFTYYPLAAWILLLTAVGYAWVVLILLSAGRMRHLPPWLPRAMTAIDTVLIAALAGVTGGAQSPAAPVLLLVVLAVAMRFRLRIGLTALAWTIPILVAGILFVPLPSRSGYERILDALWWTGNLTAAVLGPGVLSNRLQLASRRRAEAQAEAQVEHQRVAHEQLLRHHVETMEADRREYLSAVVHDCRPPVSSLESLCRGLGRDWEQLSGEEQAEILERIQGHARHLDFMLRELAEVIVSESLGAEHRAERADIPVSELLASAAATAGLPDERVVATVEPDLRVLRTDPGKCVRIIANLLEDAASHSPGGEPVEVHVGRMNGVVELSVADRRVEPGPDGSGERDGPGLGLWIASRFTEALGGAMESEPRPGGGLLLRVRFPA